MQLNLVIDMRRTSPNIGLAGMANVADADRVVLVYAGREAVRAVPLECGVLDIVQGRSRGRYGPCGSFSMGRAVAALAEHAALVASVVDERAEQTRIPDIIGAGVMRMAGNRACAGARVEAGRQRGFLPGLSELTGGDSLVQVAVAIHAPQV
jgi:hypothetical protein